MNDEEFAKRRIESFKYSRQRRKKFWRVFKIVFFAILITIIAISTFSYKVIFSQDSVLGGIGRLPVIKQFRQIFGMENFSGELDDRINFLLLGQGGVGHEGPYLTDTIIFASLKPTTQEVAMISIPRDFYVNIKNNGWHRINAANSIGETSDYKGDGAAFTAKVVEDIFDMPIHYWLRVDFDAFLEVVDDLGGVEVCVDSAFEDHNYPTDDFLTQTISFEAGCQNMDGDTALKFVRSRHGTNGEGSDFARAARQQKVILAVKNKALSLGTLVNPKKVYNIYHAVQDNIQTNIELAQIPHFLKLADGFDEQGLRRIVLDNSPKGLLRADITEDGMFVLLPRTGDYSELQNLAKNIFIISNGHDWEPVNVMVLNGTKVVGWAADIAGYLSSLNFKIIKTGNTPAINEESNERHKYEKSVVYDLKTSEREDVIMVLRKSLDANVTDIVPEFLNDEIEYYENLDFLIVLGCTDCEPEPDEMNEDL